MLDGLLDGLDALLGDPEVVARDEDLLRAGLATLLGDLLQLLLVTRDQGQLRAQGGKVGSSAWKN